MEQISYVCLYVFSSLQVWQKNLPGLVADFLYILFSVLESISSKESWMFWNIPENKSILKEGDFDYNVTSFSLFPRCSLLLCKYLLLNLGLLVELVEVVDNDGDGQGDAEHPADGARWDNEITSWQKVRIWNNFWAYLIPPVFQTRWLGQCLHSQLRSWWWLPSTEPGTLIMDGIHVILIV